MVESDFSVCVGCEQIIFSQMYVMYVKEDRNKPLRTDIFLCKRCYNESNLRFLQ